MVKILRTISSSNLFLFLRLYIEAQYPELYMKGLFLRVISTHFVQKKGHFMTILSELAKKLRT